MTDEGKEEVLELARQRVANDRPIGSSVAAVLLDIIDRLEKDLKGACAALYDLSQESDNYRLGQQTERARIIDFLKSIQTSDWEGRPLKTATVRAEDVIRFVLHGGMTRDPLPHEKLLAERHELLEMVRRMTRAREESRHIVSFSTGGMESVLDEAIALLRKIDGKEV